MWTLKRNDTNEVTKQKPAHRLMVAWETGWEEGTLRVWDGHVHTAVFRIGSRQGPTLQHRELCSRLCDGLDGRGVWGRMDRVHVWPSPFAVHLKLSQHCQSTIPDTK